MLNQPAGMTVICKLDAMNDGKNNSMKLEKEMSRHCRIATHRGVTFRHIAHGFVVLLMMSIFPRASFAADNVFPPLKETRLYRETATDCQRLDLSTWSHPTQTVLERRKWLTLDWVELCNKRKYPIFGVHFSYDPPRANAGLFSAALPGYAEGQWASSVFVCRVERRCHYQYCVGFKK
jgi:hypothetical protein